MDITYDLDIKSHENKFLRTAELAMEWGEKAAVPGAFLVNTFPFRPSSPCGPRTSLLIQIQVEHIPGYFPGTGFKRYAKETRRIFDAAVNRPLEHVKESLKVCLCDPCECLGSSANGCG